jgi:hypothetical protein
MVIQKEGGTVGDEARIDFSMTSLNPTPTQPYGVRLGARRVGAGAASDFYIATTDTISANNEHFRVTSTGNVGIGTNNPQFKLQVEGTLRATNDVSFTKNLVYHNLSQSTYSDTSWHGSRYNPIRYRGTNAVPLAVQPSDRIFWFDSSAFDGTTVTRAGEFASIVDGPVSNGVVPGSWQFSTNDLTGVNRSRLTMKANDNIHMANFGGNVGIGTITPQSKLQVNGAVQVADDTSAAGPSREGAIRYRKNANNSYCEMCMQTGASTYAWVVIKQNTW